MAKYRYRYTNVPSVIQGDVPDGDEKCVVCGKNMPCDFHHLLNGTRKKFSEDEGFWVWLCRRDHRWLHDTNQGHLLWNRWRSTCQEKYEQMHDREEWMRYAHKNYR